MGILHVSHARKYVKKPFLKSLNTVWCTHPTKHWKVLESFILYFEANVVYLNTFVKGRGGRKEKTRHTVTYLRYQEVWAVSLKQISLVLRRESWSHCCRGYQYLDCRSSHNWLHWKGCCTNSVSWELQEWGEKWWIILNESMKNKYSIILCLHCDLITVQFK